MNLKQTLLRVVFAVVAVAVFPGLAAAQGITSVTVSPNPVVAGNPVTITVNGSGACNQLNVDFGDGQRTNSGTILTWPHTFQHTYAVPLGPKTITAWGFGCPDTVTPQFSVTLTVVAGPGQVTGFSLPPTATQGESVTFQVTGTGYCDQLDLDFGDGKPHATPFGFTFPREIGHIYDQPGAKALRATGGGRCQGQATATLTVAPGLQAVPAVPVPTSRVAQLCRLINCSSPAPTPPPTPTPPKINSVRGPITPGGVVYIHGSGFGSTRDILQLRGQFPGQVLNLEVSPPEEWTDTLVVATIPDVSGVPDHNATLVIERRGIGASSWPVSFTATRAPIVLPGNKVQVISCVDADDRNKCRPHPNPLASIWGEHAGWLAGARGTDVYSVTLQNGWVIDDVKAWRVDALKGFTKGSASATLAVDWSYGLAPANLMNYGISIHIVGPKGVPY